MLLFCCLVVFNATYNNISVISGWSVLLVEETGGPGGNHRPVEVTDKLYHIMLYTSPSTRFELTTSVGSNPVEGRKKKLTALKSNSNTVWFNFQTYIYIYINV